MIPRRNKKTLGKKQAQSKPKPKPVQQPIVDTELPADKHNLPQPVIHPKPQYTPDYIEPWESWNPRRWGLLDYSDYPTQEESNDPALKKLGVNQDYVYKKQIVKTKPEEKEEYPGTSTTYDEALNKYIEFAKQNEGTGKVENGLFIQYDSLEGGNPTIGYGHKVTDKELRNHRFKNGLTKEEAEQLLREDIQSHYNSTRKFMGKDYFNTLPYDQQMMLTDYDFNLGSLSGFPTFVDAVKAYNAATTDEERIKQREIIGANYARHSGGKPIWLRNATTLDKYLIPSFKIKKAMTDPSKYIHEKIPVPHFIYGAIQPIDDNRGQWAYPGEVTRIASNDITMKGVPYPVLGVGADGEQRMMYPNEEHTFNQGPVTEYPMMQAQNGGWLSQYQSGGETFNYYTLPNGKKVRVENTNEGVSHYDPVTQTISFNPNDDPSNPEAVLQHEGLHAWQDEEGQMHINTPNSYGPLKRPNIVQNGSFDEVLNYFNRRPLDEEYKTNQVLQRDPEFQFIPGDLLYNGHGAFPGVNELMYRDPRTVEGQARDYEYAFRRGEVKNPVIINEYQNGGEFHHIKNNLFNRTFRDRRLMKQEILDENPALQQVMSLDNMNIDYARGQQRRLLEELHHNPEYFDKDNNRNGVLDNQNDTDEGEPYSGDITMEEGVVKNPHPGEFTTLINKRGMSRQQIKEAAANDFISHSLHYLPKYQNYTKKLNDVLLTKYPQEMIEGNGGVDAYMRSLFTDSPDYAPYKQEMNFVDPKLLDEIKSYVKGTPQYKRGGVTWLNEYAQGGETFTAGGEKHKVYEKESPTGNGKGVKGHIMVTHPTTDKGQWDTIDLTKIAGAKTVAQGVAATKKWHAENPEYQTGGPFLPGMNPLMPNVLMSPRQLKNTTEVVLDATSFVPELAAPAYLASLPFTFYDLGEDLYMHKPWYKTAADAAGLIPYVKYIKHLPASGLEKAARVVKELKGLNNAVNVFNTVNDVTDTYNDSNLPPGAMLPQVTITPKKKDGGWLNSYK